MKSRTAFLLTLVLLVVFANLTCIQSSDAAHWEWQNPLPQGNELEAVWGIATDNAFAVGDNGTILNTSDGINWIPMKSGTTEGLNGVWGADFSNVFAVGDRGTILKFDGNTWAAMESNTTQQLYAVWGSGPNDVYATSYSGDIFHYNGSWSQLNHGLITTANLYGIWGTGPNDIWVVGSNSTIMHYDGSWALITDHGLTNRDLYSVWGDGTNLFIGASSGRVWQYDGDTTWTDPLVGASSLQGVWGDPGNDVFFVENSGSIYHYDYSTSWTPMTSGTITSLNGVWGTAGDEMLAVGASGTILTYNGSWASLTTIETLEMQYDTWGSSANDIYSVGANGSIIHFDGGGWSAQTSNTTRRLESVWGSGPSDVFAVGFFGNILHNNGGSVWTIMDSGTTEELWDVWGTSGSDVFAVGGTGTILHYNGSNWEPMDSGTTSTIYAVWAASPTDAYAITNWEILHYDGNTWVEVTDVPYSIEMEDGDIWGSSPDNIYIVGRYGEVLHFNGYVWDFLDFGFDDLIKVWGAADTQEPHVYISNGDEIFHFDGNYWIDISNGSMPSISSIWADADDNVYAVGSDGAVLRYTYQTYYVDMDGGSDTANGDQGTPWKTLHHAVAEINAKPAGNYILSVAPGIYSRDNGEPDEITTGVITITQDWLVIQGQLGAIIDGTNATYWQNGLIIQAEGVRIQGFDIGNFQSAGLRIQNCSPLILNNSFHHNAASQIYIGSDAGTTITPIIQNNVIQPSTGFDGITVEPEVDRPGSEAEPQIYHNTIDSGMGSGINLMDTGADADIKFNIITNFEFGLTDNSGGADIEYNNFYGNIQGCTGLGCPISGTGNLALDPLFEVGPSVLLTDASPCIDAIPENADDPLVSDFAGRPRPLGGEHDMGAYEGYDDGLAPKIILPPTITYISSNSAVVEWYTDELSEGDVQYGITPSGWGMYDDTQSHTGYTKYHRVVLSGLDSDKWYFLSVGGRDVFGNGYTVSNEHQFKTRQDLDTLGPVLEAPPAITYLSNTAVIIEWQTDEPANTQIQYGLNSTGWGGVYVS